MNVGSLFSGVGGFDLGLERAGHRIVFQCEKDARCRGILAQHWPDMPCFEDVRDIRDPTRAGSGKRQRDNRGRDDRLDLLCGGFPCQDLSVAGRRAGLAGERSGLFFEFARVADDLVRPGGWLLIENVPGLLSSASGRDFAVLLRTLGDIGFHDLAWRVLDSRYFGVPQRRRRVYILGRRAAGDRARAVLLEPESGGGDFAPSAEARTRVAASLVSGSHGPGISPPGRRDRYDENIVVSALQRETSGAGGHRLGAEEAAGGQLVTGTVRSHVRPGSNDSGGIVVDASKDGTGRGTPLTIAGPLGGGNDGAGRRCQDDPNLVCSSPDAHGVRATPELPRRLDDPIAFNLRGRDEGARLEVADVASIRAAQGGSSRSYIHGSGSGSALDPKPDGPRYAAMGNAVTVNVAHWIGLRLAAEAERERLAA